MSRLLLAAAAVLLLPAALFAQYPQRPLAPSSPGLAAGVGNSLYRPGPMGFGAGFGSPFYFNRGYPGFYPYYYAPYYAPYTSYFGGGFYGDFGYSPYYAFPYDQPAIEYIPAPAPMRVVELSNEFPATLTLDFPAAAKVWLDGKEVEGEAATERVLTSAVLKPGQTYTFKVRAEWESNGKTYTYTREATLGPGDHSKVQVVRGTEKEKQ
jgi:uncharacterized protein (TIGR03000 family)